MRISITLHIIAICMYLHLPVAYAQHKHSGKSEIQSERIDNYVGVITAPWSAWTRAREYKGKIFQVATVPSHITINHDLRIVIRSLTTHSTMKFSFESDHAWGRCSKDKTYFAATFTIQKNKWLCLRYQTADGGYHLYFTMISSKKPWSKRRLVQKFIGRYSQKINEFRQVWHLDGVELIPLPSGMSLKTYERQEEQKTQSHNRDKTIDFFSSKHLKSRGDNSHSQFLGSSPFA